MFTIFCTQVLGLGVNILVNVAVYPAILSCSRSQIVKIIADQRKMTLLAIMLISYLCLRVIGNIITSPEKDDWLQQTKLRIAPAENGSI